MKSLALKNIFILIIIIFTSNISKASITIDSVSTIKSSCTNNGSARVYAKSNPVSTLLYSIVAGPITSPLQNSTTFSSLFPGVYKVRVYTSNFDSTETTFTITGNYQLPNFTLDGINPTCPFSNDGSIKVVVDSSLGLQPYLYSMTSPYTVSPSATDSFPNLNVNSYLIRVTDACGNYQTRTEILTAYGTGLTTYGTYLYPNLAKIGCDTFELTQYIYLYNEKSNQPLTYTTYTNNGTTTKTEYAIPVNTISQSPELYKIIDTIPNVNYGDYLYFTITDVCGQSVNSALSQIPPFDFEMYYSTTFTNCVETYTGGFQLKQFPNYPFFNTTPIGPLTFHLTDIITNIVVDSMISVPYYFISLKPETSGNFYNLIVSDTCGSTWSSVIQWPSAGIPSTIIYTNIGCLDSTAVLILEHHNFKTGVHVTILSGPSFAESTKSFFAYHDTITYPRVIYGAIPNVIYVKDLPIGYYTYEVSDSCGNSILGSFTIEPYMVSNLGFYWHVKPSCLNNNTLYYNLSLGNSYVSYTSITDLATNQIVALPVYNYTIDSISTLPIGQYGLEIYYGNHNGNGAYYDGSLIANGNDCWVVRDTISITPYANNSFITNYTIYCNGTNYVELIVDSTRGVPPYKFEIISGPQIYAQQDSGIFQINIFGNYLISLEDICGNNYTQQITLSSDSFPPINKNGFLCSGQDVVLSAISSSHFTYLWQYPNGNIITGDSISFHPFAASDTGNYYVTKIVNINGCNDTLHTIYHLSLNDSIPQLLSICQGDSVFVGTSIYTIPGVYYDTLSTTFGCDSVIVTTLKYTPLLVDTNNVKICFGDSVIIGNNIYTLQGMYSDTLTILGNCKKILLTVLGLNNIVDSISATICLGDSISIGNFTYSQSGIYKDTLTSSLGCDSVIVASITIANLVVDSNTVNICNGDSLIVGSSIYNSSGVYSDTVFVAGGCKKIILTNLSVIHIVDSINAAICAGDSITIGNTTYHQPGIYSDTLTSAIGCDSIIIASITFTNLLIDSNTVQICHGDSVIVGTNSYNLTGNYTDTITIAGSCKKIILTNLSVINIVDSISAAICVGDSITIGNTTYHQPGIYSDTLTSAIGCDSIIIASITFTNLLIDSNTIQICRGDSVVVGTNSYSIPGNYTDTIAIAGGCKKIILTNLSVIHIVDSISAAICVGDSISIGNTTYHQPGIYSDTLTSAIGCDSIIIASITFTNLLIDSNTVQICRGDSVVVGMNSYSIPGTYIDTIAIAGGCKKIIFTNLSIHQIIDSISVTLCVGDSITIGNSIYNQPGIYTDTLTSSLGCDSVIILTLKQTIRGISNTYATICNGENYAFGNNNYNQTGIFSHSIPNQNCDSIAILNLTVEPLPDASIYVSQDTIQAGYNIQLVSNNTQALSYFWNGNAFFSNPNFSNTTAIINSATWIYLIVSDANSCKNIDSIFINIKNNDGDNCEDAYLFVPNTFTPNQDGINDRYNFVASNITVNSLLIFNRWGAKIFESKSDNFAWDGKYRNVDCTEGVYYFLIEYESCVDKSKKFKHGNITLLR